MESCSPIELLPSSLLSKIFTYLPLKDRYLVCLVSGKWAEVSRDPWTDIASLNLSLIPRAMADPILVLCPKLALIEASDHTIVLEKNKNALANESVRTLKFRNVTFAGPDLTPLIPSDAVERRIVTSARSLIRKYFERFPKLSELTLLDCQVAYSPSQHPAVAAAAAEHDGGLANVFGLVLRFRVSEHMAASINAVLLRAPDEGDVIYINISFEGAQNMECAYLDGNVLRGVYGFDLPRLRELCLVGCFEMAHVTLTMLAGQIGEGDFPSLEVFFYASDHYVGPDCVTQLITAKVALRILVIAGKDRDLSDGHEMYDMEEEHGWVHLDNDIYPIVLPPRQASSDAAASNQPRLPPLQIFVGGDFTKHVRFTAPKSEVANFWRIDCPMPEYLAKPKIAEVFKDAWLAKIIREGPENGLAPWGSPDRMNLFYSSSDLMFC